MLILLLIFLLIISPAEAKDLSGKFALNGKTGYFLPKIDSDVNEYGGGQVFSLGGEYNLSPAFSILLSLDYKKLDYNGEKGDWELKYVEEDYLRIIPITFSMIYKMPIGNQKDFLSYTGGGIGVYLAKLSFIISELPNRYDWTIGSRGKFPKIIVSNSNPSYSSSVRTTGFHLLAGFRYHLFSQIFLNGEMKYAYAFVSEWNDIDLGGMTITGGINYSF